jgi:hypothetical protein
MSTRINLYPHPTKYTEDKYYTKMTKVKVKVVLVLFQTEHHAMKAY